MNNLPNNLEEALIELENITNEKEKEMLLSDQGAALHFGLGRFIRNTWGLWDENSPLNKWFVSNGIHHADDMSAVIFRAYRRKKLGHPHSIEAEAKHYQLNWPEMEELNKTGKTNVKFVTEVNEYGERTVRIVSAS